MTTFSEVAKWSEDGRIPSPRNDVVLILVEGESKTESGILMPDGAKEDEPMAVGWVIRVGPGGYNQTGTRNKMDDIAPSDKVHFRQRGGTKIEMDSKEFYLVNDINIFGVYDKPTESDDSE